MVELTFQGHHHFRQRLVLATLSGKSISIQNIRSNDDQLGIRDYEASFLRLIEKITNGSVIEINYTGTSIYYKPGIIVGGSIDHQCPNSRSIGYFLESIIALAPFGKKPTQLTMSGITNDNVDTTVFRLSMT
jgi:RNA 3'-terminal phosphate cyclase-like protein